MKNFLRATLRNVTASVGILAVFLFFTPVYYASAATIAYDTSGTASGTSPSFNLTAGGSGELAIMYYAYGTGQCTNPGAPSVGGSTAGVTQIISDVTNAPTGNTEAFYYLANPPTSSSAYSVTCSDGVTLFVSIYSGAKLTGIPDSSSTNSAAGCTAYTQNTTVVASGSWLVAYYACSGSGSTVQTTGNSGTTIRQGTNTVIADSNGTVGTGAQTLSFTNTGRTTSNEVVFSLAPAATAAPAVQFLWGLVRAVWIW